MMTSTEAKRLGFTVHAAINDLVERLRQSVTKGHEPTDELAMEAAAEIERLRGEMSTEFAPGFCHELGRKCIDARAEIERLRLQCAALLRAAKIVVDECTPLQGPSNGAVELLESAIKLAEGK